LPSLEVILLPLPSKRAYGANVKNIYYTLGSRDIIAIVEAPDDETATALALSVCSRGNVRSETLRAFSLSEMKSILDRVS
jgi:uncharacterized protein with GYD domain